MVNVAEPEPIEEGAHREGGRVIGCWSLWRREDAAAQGIEIVCEPGSDTGLFEFYCAGCYGDGVCTQQEDEEEDEDDPRNW